MIYRYARITAASKSNRKLIPDGNSSPHESTLATSKTVNEKRKIIDHALFFSSLYLPSREAHCTSRRRLPGNKAAAVLLNEAQVRGGGGGGGVYPHPAVRDPVQLGVLPPRIGHDVDARDAGELPRGRRIYPRALRKQTERKKEIGSPGYGNDDE